MPFEPGKIANPKGRPIKTNMATLEARKHAEKAIARLVEALDTENHETRIRAANSLLDRAYGKPKESVEMTGEDGGPIETRAISPTAEWLAGLLRSRAETSPQTSSEN